MNRVEPNRNVYIGHRYVPLLVGEWDKSIQYEGLSIVTFKGASYTSKKSTPAGIDIENEEYWVLTGNYNAQIEYYREETERVSDDLAQAKIDLNQRIDVTVEYVDSEVEDLAGLVNDDIDDFKKITSLKMKEISYNVTDYGLKGDGHFINTDKFNEMINEIPENSKVIFPTGTYIGNFKSDKAIHIDFMNSTLISEKDNEPILEFTGRSSPGSYQLENDVERHDTILKLSGVPNNIVSGDVIVLRDDSTRLGDGLPNVNIEIHKVRSVSGNDIILDSYVHLNKKTSMNNVMKINPLKNIKVENLKMIGTSNADEFQFGAYFNYCENVDLQNVRMINNVGSAVRFSGCYNVNFENFVFEDPIRTSGGEGYGVLVTGGTSIFNIENGIGRKMRHVIDLGQSHDGTIKNIKSYDGKDSPFVISHNTYDSDISFYNCHSFKGLTTSNGFVYSGQGVQNPYDATAYGIKIIDCTSNDRSGIRIDVNIKESIIQNFKCVKKELSGLGTGIILKSQNDVIIKDVEIKGYNRGVLIESPSYPMENNMDMTQLENIKIVDVSEGIRFGFIKNISFKNIRMIRVYEGFKSTYNDDGIKLRYFNMKDISFEGVSSPFLFSNRMLDDEGVTGVIENIRLNTTGNSNMFTASNDGYIFTDLTQLLIRVNMNGNYIPIRALAGENVILNEDPFPEKGIVTGHKITIFNIGDAGSISIPQGLNNVNKNKDTTIIDVGESTDYVFYRDKWYEI